MSEIAKAIEILKSGGIVIFPTDTAFGIGCRVDDNKATERLFKIRKRPNSMAVPILADSIEMVKEYIEEIPDDVQALMNKYWSGALTIVLQSRIDKIPALVRGGGSTIGIRIPDNKIILEIIKGIGVPILGPSANFHGGKTPYKFEDLDRNLINLVDFVVEGKTSEKNVSTVIDCSIRPWKILREGAIKIKNITLLIDTTSSQEIVVGLAIGNKKYIEKKKLNSKKREVVLELIQKLIKKNKISLKDLNGIEINPGPGSFTGIRVGISIANALSFALNIPVNGKIGGELNPVYND